MSRLGRREAWARTGQREGNRQETGSWRHQNQKRSLGCILHTGGCLWEGWCFYFLGDFLKLWYNVYNMKFTIVTVFHCRFRDIKYVPILGQPAPLFPFGALSSCKTESLSPLEDDPPSARAQPLATACLLSVSVSLTPGGPSWK